MEGNRGYTNDEEVVEMTVRPFGRSSTRWSYSSPGGAPTVAQLKLIKLPL